MSVVPSTGHLDIAPHRLEYRWAGPRPDLAPTLVLLHEGLGCVGLWADFPDKLAAATGLGVFAYSRAGYGRSSPAPLPWPLDFMNREAQDVLPRVLDAIGFRSGLLVGHSDGASIAAIHCGSVEDHRVKGAVLIAPHFFTEEMGLTEIARAKDAYDSGDLRARLARWHDAPDNAFRGWNGVWLDPDFRAWDITGVLAYIRAPLLVVQGADDQYGTARQVEVVAQECYCPVETRILPGVRHSPHREAPDVLVREIAEFAKRVL